LIGHGKKEENVGSHRKTTKRRCAGSPVFLFVWAGCSWLWLAVLLYRKAAVQEKLLLLVLLFGNLAACLAVN
jgi:hypothetical protein